VICFAPIATALDTRRWVAHTTEESKKTMGLSTLRRHREVQPVQTSPKPEPVVAPALEDKTPKPKKTKIEKE
jgi:hypothetical protein